jgi:hypothetical protein
VRQHQSLQLTLDDRAKFCKTKVLSAVLARRRFDILFAIILLPCTTQSARTFINALKSALCGVELNANLRCARKKFSGGTDVASH